MELLVREALKQEDHSTARCKIVTDKVIAEASPWDAIWGIGLQVEDPMILDTSIWGENLLGKALMEVREELRKTKGELK